MDLIRIIKLQLEVITVPYTYITSTHTHTYMYTHNTYTHFTHTHHTHAYTYTHNTNTHHIHTHNTHTLHKCTLRTHICTHRRDGPSLHCEQVAVCNDTDSPAIHRCTCMLGSPLLSHFFLFSLFSVPVPHLTQTVNVDNRQVTLDMWDTSGQERHHSLASIYCRSTNAAIVVYDITNMVRHLLSAIQEG